MSSRHESQARTIHPRALAELGEEACVVALGVARDLRNGVIPRKNYNQQNYCGTACCIAGHMAERLGVPVGDFINRRGIIASGALRFTRRSLFGGGPNHSAPVHPMEAADAIERYIYLGSVTPWTA